MNFPFKYNFPKKNIGKLSMHAQNVPKVGRNCISARENISLSEAFSSPHALLRYLKCKIALDQEPQDTEPRNS